MTSVTNSVVIISSSIFSSAAGAGGLVPLSMIPFSYHGLIEGIDRLAFWLRIGRCTLDLAMMGSPGLLARLSKYEHLDLVSFGASLIILLSFPFHPDIWVFCSSTEMQGHFSLVHGREAHGDQAQRRASHKN